MSKRKQHEMMQDDGTYVVKKNHKMNIAAFIICLLIAFIIWIYATNVEAKEEAEERQENSASTMVEADQFAIEL